MNFVPAGFIEEAEAALEFEEDARGVRQGRSDNLNAAASGMACEARLSHVVPVHGAFFL